MMNLFYRTLVDRFRTIVLLVGELDSCSTGGKQVDSCNPAGVIGSEKDNRKRNIIRLACSA
jgi:hypothetical protein